MRSPKFSHFDVVVIISITLYRWETLPKLTVRPVIHNPHTLHGPTILSMVTLHCGYQRSEVSPALVQQSCFAQLQSNLDNIVVPEPSNPPELGAAMRMLQRYLHCSMGLSKLVFAEHGNLCAVLFRLSRIPLGVSPLPGISLTFQDNLLD